MTLPNFLIIGAAKSGTSSLRKYLNEHPDIYGDVAIEPGFFAFEGVKPSFAGPGDEILNDAVVTNLTDYEALFEGVRDESAIGEASVVYLYSEQAPRRIRHYIPDARLIVILRNPVERAVSSFAHLVRDGFEPIQDFRRALDAEDERIRQNWQHLWHYKRMGFYSEQLGRYLDLFPAHQLAIYTYDDFSERPLEVIQQLFTFLEVDDSFVPDLSRRYNVSGRPRSRLLHSLLTKPSLVRRALKPFVPGAVRAGVQKALMDRNLKQGKASVPDATLDYLKSLYRDDILKLESHLQRDLSAWLK